MKRILEFLNKAGIYYLATSQGDTPHVRPLGFVMDCKGKLAFCTSNQKNMYKQLKENPKVEICAFDGKETLRICGKAVFATSEETQRLALETMPALSGMYSVGDGIFEIFYIDEIKACCASMGQASEEWIIK